jgi:hypothetical protein
MSLNKGTRTRKDWLESEFAGTPREAEKVAEENLRRENEAIWAFYRDPKTDLTQVEARDRAQSRDYGNFNISQSSLSRLIKRFDDVVLLEPIKSRPFFRDVTTEDFENWDHVQGGIVDDVQHEIYAKHAPELLDAMRAAVARSIVDWKALRTFDSASRRTPEWAQNRFDVDPNIGLHIRENRQHPDEQVDPHEPHDTS